MSAFSTHLETARLWLPAVAIVLITSGTLSVMRRPLGHFRWLVAGFVLLAPLMLPALDPDQPRIWRVLDTIVTTFAIAAAVRLPSYDRVVVEQARPRTQMFLWLTAPMARFRETDPNRRAELRGRAGGYLLRGLAKRAAWEPLGWYIASSSGSDIPWPVRSAMLMLYFVLNITAISDLFSGGCLLLGCPVDTIFDAPLLAKSPRDFWSTRWNKFISRFALKEVALPLGRRWGKTGIFLGVFATSGLFHEYFAWGVGAGDARYGVMSTFFVIQGIVVWAGDRLPLPPLPHALGTALTFAWMMVSAPLFFLAIEPAVLAFGYPASWLPFGGNPLVAPLPF